MGPRLLTLHPACLHTNPVLRPEYPPMGSEHLRNDLSVHKITYKVSSKMQKYLPSPECSKEEKEMTISKVPSVPARYCSRNSAGLINERPGYSLRRKLNLVIKGFLTTNNLFCKIYIFLITPPPHFLFYVLPNKALEDIAEAIEY